MRILDALKKRMNSEMIRMGTNLTSKYEITGDHRVRIVEIPLGGVRVPSEAPKKLIDWIRENVQKESTSQCISRKNADGETEFWQANLFQNHDGTGATCKILFYVIKSNPDGV